MASYDGDPAIQKSMPRIQFCVRLTLLIAVNRNLHLPWRVKKLTDPSVRARRPFPCALRSTLDVD